MKCIYCGTPLSSIDYCTGCGADITIQKRIIRISNLLYNEGLEKATVRDLSGAITCLKRSLKFNKENVDARNLLGLVYYETGEVVSALSEWVISKNLQVPENAADGYITKLQSNKNKLDTINQTIKKYNQSLLYCKQDNEDMAVIQLKKILIQNPKLIKGYHLLGLLYLKRQDYEKARKLLRKAIRTDATNTTTLRYLREIEEATGISTSLDVKRRKRYAKDADSLEQRLTGPSTYFSGNDRIIQPTPFRDSSTVATFINIFLGLILGGAIVWFLAVPSNIQKINQKANKQVTEANTKLASEVAKTDNLQKEIDEYQAKVEKAKKTMDAAKAKATGYEALLKASNLFVAGDQTGVAAALAEIDAKSLDGTGKELYDKLKEGVKTFLFSNDYDAGTVAYVAGDYKTAIEKLLKASETDPESYDAKFWLAMAYFNSNDKTKADKVFKEIIAKFPDKEAELGQYITTSGTGGTTANPDGTTPSPGGTTANPDGTTANPDGTTPSPDGTTANPDGTTPNPDGTTANPDGTIPSPDGT